MEAPPTPEASEPLARVARGGAGACAAMEMRHFRRVFATRLAPLLIAVFAAAAATPVPPDLAAPLAAIRAVGPEGAGNAAASVAWRTLASRGANELTFLLEAMAGANDLAQNWLRAAVDTIASREIAAGRTLPMPGLLEFLRDRTQDPQARWLAYQWIARQDPARAAELAPTMLDDPSNALRREGVARLVREAATFQAGGNHEGAVARYRPALEAARDLDQVEAIAKALRELGEAVNLQEVFGWVTNWKVIGPFDNTGRAGFERVFPPETELRPDAEYDGKTGKVRWRELRTADAYGMLDLNKPLGAAKEVTGYAWAEFEAAQESSAELRLGCKNGWKIWFNGQFVFGRDEYHRGAEIDQYRLPVTLKPGPNTILVKLCQNEEVEDWTVEWEFQLRVTDPAGKPIRAGSDGQAR